MKKISMVAQILPLFVLIGPAAAATDGRDPLTYDRVTLAAAATREVDNDTLVVTLAAQREGGDPGRLADEVNRTVRKALDQARTVEGVRAQTLDYQTTPVYRDQQVVGWRVSQSLRLESEDEARLGTLLGELQKDLAVRSVDYAVSPARRAEAEESLTREALDAFSRRAQLVAQQLGRPGYRLVEIVVETAGEPLPRPMPMAMRAAAMAEAAPPALEAGTQTVTVTARGTVELERP
jgi:predicted secreted protein